MAMVVPTARRRGATATPIGLLKAREGGLTWAPSLRNSTSRPAWYVLTTRVMPSSQSKAGKLGVWMLRKGGNSAADGGVVISVMISARERENVAGSQP